LYFYAKYFKLMKKTTSLNQSKLAGYTAVVGAIVAGGAANAQITYMDVNPDVVVDSNTTLINPYAIDFNNDANPDIVFGVAHIEGAGSSFTYKGALAYAAFPTNNAIIAADTAVMASALDCGVAVSAAATFGTDSYGNFGYAALINGSIPFTSTTTPFLGATDKYLGVKFTAASGTHYGWVKLSVAANAETITVKEYAFNATPDAAINTCQTAGIENVSVEDKVSIKTTLNDATINVTPDLVGGSISMISMSGQVVKTIAISDVNTTISFEGIDSGIYSVVANFEAGSVNKRVYVK
jgi:ABC-type methionine transport system permease subunit